MMRRWVECVSRDLRMAARAWRTRPWRGATIVISLGGEDA